MSTRPIVLFVSLTIALLVGSARAGAQQIASGSEVKLLTCFSCHGENGAAPKPMTPILAGQEFYYLYVQLRDFAAGRRQHEVMSPIAQALTKEEMQAMAKFLSEQTWPRNDYKSDPALAKAGRMALSAGECAVCHLGEYKGNSRVPRTAGQNVGYLEKTMRDFKTKTRNNAPSMGSLMKSYSDEDIAAMAEYLAGL